MTQHTPHTTQDAIETHDRSAVLDTLYSASTLSETFLRHTMLADTKGINSYSRRGSAEVASDAYIRLDRIVETIKMADEA